MTQHTVDLQRHEGDLVRKVDELAALYELTDRLYRARSPRDIYDAALDTITDALGCSRASILLFDKAGVLRFVAWRGLSERYRQKLEGHTPWRPGDADPEPIFVSDIEETDESEVVKKTVLQEGIRALSFIPLVAKGGVVGKFMCYFASPRSFGKHEVDLAVAISRQLGFSIERGLAEQARHAAEEDLRRSEERYRHMLETAPVMMWSSDTEGRCRHLNAQLRSFWGVGLKEIKSFDFISTIHPDDAAEVARIMGEATASRTEVTLKARYRNSKGQYRVLETSARPDFSSDGEFVGLLGVNVDLTEREEHEAQLQLLLHELNHRVKNTLAIVQAIAHRTFRDVAGSEAARAAFEARLRSLANAHNLLTQSNWESAEIDRVVSETIRNHEVDAARVSVSGPHILLQPDQALALAMAIHELCTNAIKYGALSNDIGRVECCWREEQGGGHVELIWRERGGPAVQRPASRGFGSFLIEQNLAARFDGQASMDFRPEGLVCRLVAPRPA